MTDTQRKKDDEILQALDLLQDADVTEAEADAAFHTLARRLPKPLPRASFAARVMYAVQQAPLPAGRVALISRPPRRLFVGIGAMASVAALWVALLLAPVTLPIFARVFAFAVQASLLVIPPLTAGLDVWAVISTAAQTIAEALTLPEMLSALAVVTSVGVLSLGALARVISSQQESTNGITSLCI